MAEDNNLDGSAGVIAGLLDPVADTIEKGLSKIGLGKVAKAWIKGESTVLLLGPGPNNTLGMIPGNVQLSDGINMTDITKPGFQAMVKN